MVRWIVESLFYVAVHNTSKWKLWDKGGAITGQKPENMKMLMSYL